MTLSQQPTLFTSRLIAGDNWSDWFTCIKKPLQMYFHCSVSAKFCAYVVYSLEPILCQPIARFSVSMCGKIFCVGLTRCCSFFNMDVAIVQMGLRCSKLTLLLIFVSMCLKSSSVGKTVGCSLWFALLTWLLPLCRCWWIWDTKLRCRETCSSKSQRALPIRRNLQAFIPESKFTTCWPVCIA